MTAETDGGERRRGGIAADKIRILVVDDHALFRGGITQVLTSKKVLDKFGITPKGDLIFLEDVPRQVKPLDKGWPSASGTAN